MPNYNTAVTNITHARICMHAYLNSLLHIPECLNTKYQLQCFSNA